VITELNGWDSFNPGHLDQHLLPFYERGLAAGTLTRESARELLECFFIKFNNHPAPPKVGVTAAESGTYTDFANINIGGLLRDGSDGANEVSHILLDIVDEMHLLQPAPIFNCRAKAPRPFSNMPCASLATAMASPPFLMPTPSSKSNCARGKASRRPGRRLQRLRRSRRFRQGSLYFNRLFQSAQGV